MCHRSHVKHTVLVQMTNPRPYITKASVGPYWFWQQASLMSTCLQTRKLSYSKLLVRLNCVLGSRSVSSRHLEKLSDPTGVSLVLLPERRAGEWRVPGESGVYPPWPWRHRDWVCLSVTSVCLIKHVTTPTQICWFRRWAGNGSMGFHGLLRGFSWTGFGVLTGYTVCISDTLPPPVRPRADAHEVPIVCLQQMKSSFPCLVLCPVQGQRGGARWRTDLQCSSSLVTEFMEMVRWNEVDRGFAFSLVMMCHVDRREDSSRPGQASGPWAFWVSWLHRLPLWSLARNLTPWRTVKSALCWLSGGLLAKGTSLNDFSMHPGKAQVCKERPVEPSRPGCCPHSAHTPGASGSFYFLDALLLLFSC